ncbi:hypothetical protein CLCR_09735 [Cladophialophora carrionii]|uniref:Clr5 domain-containing protein n=1 Tax=Cladophialophora carrionii TaxID=86049 RepID=A0A1C1CXT3_9EURO|nr:hypothetical protein CLCR_09735 [Cladophialophora carrionii]
MPNLCSGHTNGSTRHIRNASEQRVVARAKGPPPKEWDGVKAAVKRHYIGEGKTLQQVLEVLSKEHEFNATPAMLKRQLRLWKFPKNFKKEELKNAAEELKRCADLGLSPPQDLTIDGRAYPLDRVRRHFGSDPQYRCSSLQSDTQCKATISSLCLKPSSTNRNIEMILSSVKDHWSITLTRKETRALVRHRRNTQPKKLRSDPKDITVGFLTSLELFRQGQETRCWREVHKTCDELLNVFKLQEPDLLKEIILIFTAKAWVRHPQMFALIARYVHTLCVEAHTLGPHHPLTVILHSFGWLAQDMQLFDELVEQALKVMIDLAETARDTVQLDRDYICSVEANYVSKVRARLGFPEAKRLVEHWFAHYRRTVGERNHYTLTMQTDLARLYMAEASMARARGEKAQAEICESEAERIYVRLVQMGAKDPLDYSRNGIYISAAESLGRLYFGRQEFQKAQDHYCKALAWAADKFGDHHPYISLLLRQFTALQRMGELGLVKVKMQEDEIDDCHSMDAERHHHTSSLHGEEPCEGPSREIVEVASDAGALESRAGDTALPSWDCYPPGYMNEDELGIAEELTSITECVPEMWHPSAKQACQVPGDDLMHEEYADHAEMVDGEAPEASGDVQNGAAETILSEFMADPTPDTPDFFPGDLFEEYMPTDEVDQLCGGPQSLHVALHSV